MYTSVTLRDARSSFANPAALDAFIQEGIDAATPGELVPHEMVVAEPEAMIARHKARVEPVSKQ